RRAHLPRGRGPTARPPGVPALWHRRGRGSDPGAAAGRRGGGRARLRGRHRAPGAVRAVRDVPSGGGGVSTVAVEALDPTSPDAGVAAHYGDPLREQRVLAREVGVVDRSHRGVVAVPGEERLGWLHNLTTQHLAALSAGEGSETLVLSPHGHIEHHAVLAEDGGTTWLDTEPGAAGPLVEFFQRMRFLTRVEPRDATAERAVLSLVGPQVTTALTALGVGELASPEVLPVPPPKFRTNTIP